MGALIKPYNKEWPARFEKIKSILSKALTGVNVVIEHIGSTAVPGLAAKDIIDIDIVFFNKGDFEKIKQALISLEYFHNGDQGIPGREVFKRDKTSSMLEILDENNHHLYVCHESSIELKRHLLLRDYLRVDAHAREEYQMIKYQIAEHAKNDRKVYAGLKEENAATFVNEVLLKAEILFDH